MCGGNLCGENSFFSFLPTSKFGSNIPLILRRFTLGIVAKLHISNCRVNWLCSFRSGGNILFSERCHGCADDLKKKSFILQIFTECQIHYLWLISLLNGVCNMPRSCWVVSLTTFLKNWCPRFLPSMWRWNVEFYSSIYQTSVTWRVQWFAFITFPLVQASICPRPSNWKIQLEETGIQVKMACKERGAGCFNRVAKATLADVSFPCLCPVRKIVLGRRALPIPFCC